MTSGASLRTAVVHLQRVHYWQRRCWQYQSPDLPLQVLLIVAANNNPITHMRLCSRMPCAVPTGVKWIKRLLADGWVRSIAHVTDKRSRVVTLTTKAERHLIDCYSMQAKSLRE